MDELLVKGKDDILMLIQALDKELVRPGAWSCLGGLSLEGGLSLPIYGTCSWPACWKFPHLSSIK